MQCATKCGVPWAWMPIFQSVYRQLCGVCVVSLIFGWCEALYFLFGVSGDFSTAWAVIDTVFIAPLFFGGIGLLCISWSACCQPNGCCCPCCTCIPRLLRNRLPTDSSVLSAAPIFLLFAALPFPFKTFKMFVLQIAALSLSLCLQRGGAHFDAAFASQSCLLFTSIRVAAWSPNALLWSFPSAAALCIPLLCWRCFVWKLKNRSRPERNGSVDDNASAVAELAVASVEVESPESGTQPIVDRERDSEADPSKVAHSKAAAIFAAVWLTTFLHFVVYFTASTSLIVRGAGKDLQPELATLIPPLLPWLLAECGFIFAKPFDIDARRSLAQRLSFAGFTTISLIGAVLFFVVRLGAASVIGGSMLLMLIPWWMRLAAAKLRRWLKVPIFGASIGLMLFVQTVLLFLFFQSCIVVRGLQGICLLAILFIADIAEFLLRSRDGDAAVREPKSADKSTNSRVFLVLAIVTLSIAAALSPEAPEAVAAQNAQTLSFWTWNIQRGFSVDGLLNLQRSADLAVAERADILAFQESEALSPITGGRDVPGYVAAAMGAHYDVVYGSGGDPLTASFDGTAIVSRFPVLRAQSHRLSTYGVFPTFTLTECVLAVGERELHVLNVHPTLVPKDIQSAGIDFLVERTRAALMEGGGAHSNSSSAAVLIAGDFNVEARDSALDGLYALGLRHGLNPENDPDFVYPVTRAASGSRVDHIFFSPRTLEVYEDGASAGVVAAAEGLSDHSAVRQQFRFVDADSEE